MSMIFNQPYNLDIKIKILHHLNFGVIQKLCLRNRKILEICSTEKYWRLLIVQKYGQHFLPSNKIPIKQLINHFSLYRVVNLAGVLLVT